MCSRPQYTDLTYMGGTGSGGPMRVIFGSGFKSWYTSLNIKFGASRTFHVPKIPVYRLDCYMTGLWLIEAYLHSLEFDATSSFRDMD